MKAQPFRPADSSPNTIRGLQRVAARAADGDGQGPGDQGRGAAVTASAVPSVVIVSSSRMINPRASS